MYKVAWLVKLAESGDRDELERAWSEDHAELMRAVPGLERHTVNRGIAIAEGPGAGRDRPAVDAVAAAWFTDQAAFDSALGSPQWAAVQDHGRTIFDQGFANAGQAVEIDERIMRIGPGTPWKDSDVPRGLAKHIGVLHFRPDLTRQAGRAWWTDVHGALALKIVEIRYYVQSHAVRAWRIDGAPQDGVFVFDGFSEAWFIDRETFERSHASPAWDAARDDSPNVFDVERLESGINMFVEERIVKE